MVAQIAKTTDAFKNHGKATWQWEFTDGIKVKDLDKIPMMDDRTPLEHFSEVVLQDEKITQMKAIRALIKPIEMSPMSQIDPATKVNLWTEVRVFNALQQLTEVCLDPVHGNAAKGPILEAIQ